MYLFMTDQGLLMLQRISDSKSMVSCFWHSCKGIH